jgi:hypothetical protein
MFGLSKFVKAGWLLVLGMLAQANLAAATEFRIDLIENPVGNVTIGYECQGGSLGCTNGGSFGPWIPITFTTIANTPETASVTFDPSTFLSGPFSGPAIDITYYFTEPGTGTNPATAFVSDVFRIRIPVGGLAQLDFMSILFPDSLGTLPSTVDPSQVFEETGGPIVIPVISTLSASIESLDEFRAVPEPGTLALFGVGLFLLIGVTHRRSIKS